MLMCVFSSLTLVILPVNVMFLFFFFQAEDGIRDWSVTGVQTCALPISVRAEALPDALDHVPARARAGRQGREPALAGRLLHRSEERRVGKECRSRGSQKQ